MFIPSIRRLHLCRKICCQLKACYLLIAHCIVTSASASVAGRTEVFSHRCIKSLLLWSLGVAMLPTLAELAQLQAPFGSCDQTCWISYPNQLFGSITFRNFCCTRWAIKVLQNWVMRVPKSAFAATIACRQLSLLLPGDFCSPICRESFKPQQSLFC